MIKKDFHSSKPSENLVREMLRRGGWTIVDQGEEISIIDIIATKDGRTIGVEVEHAGPQRGWLRGKFPSWSHGPSVTERHWINYMAFRDELDEVYFVTVNTEMDGTVWIAASGLDPATMEEFEADKLVDSPSYMDRRIVVTDKSKWEYLPATAAGPP